MYNELVSIVLPTYNGSRYLRQSIDSVLSQTYTNFELIIVDDCSTDKTPEIIAEYVNADKRIRTIRHSQNEYLPQALNTGFSYAKGELFTWTSDDNLYKPNAIEHLVEILSYNKDIDVVYGNETTIDDEGNVIQGDNIEVPEVIPILSCIGGYFMFRKDVYLHVGGYEKDWFLVEDWQFWLKAYNAGYNFVKSDSEENHYLYRKHMSSLSMTRLQSIKLQALKLSLENLAQNKDKYAKQITMRAYLFNIRRCKIIDDKAKAQECLQLAQSVNPDAIQYLNPELVIWLEEN